MSFCHNLIKYYWHEQLASAGDLNCCTPIFFQVQKWTLLEKDFTIPGGELGKMLGLFLNLQARSLISNRMKSGCKISLLRFRG